MDDYGLGVAATFNETTKHEVVKTKNLMMRIDRVGQNSPVRASFFMTLGRNKKTDKILHILPQSVTTITEKEL